MATLARRNFYKRRILESIGNKSPEELGALAMDMMENMDRVYAEAGIDDSVDGDDDYFEYNRISPSEQEIEWEKQYNRLHEEYVKRFSGTGSEEIPAKQPPADDITIGINPDSGVEETAEGSGPQELVSEEEIFGEV